MVRRRRSEIEELRSEIEGSRPYLGLAREIHDEVERVVADPLSDLDELAEAIARLPRDARLDAVLAAFRGLPAGEQWDLLADLFGDDELRDALAVEHERRLAAVRRTLRLRTVLAMVDDRRVLDTRDLPPGEDLTLGLFREVDVRSALPRGSASTAVARRLVLRASDEPGRLLVLADLFNPANGLFVTPDYDEAVWREERLAPNTSVRVGTATDGAAVEPLIHPGGRLDIEAAGATRRSRLHVGAATIGDVDLFVATSQEGDRLT